MSLVREDVYLAILDSSDGKDKIAKTLQYTGRLLLWLDTTLQSRPLPHSQFTTILRSHRLFIEAITKNLSLFRKMVRFGDWVPALKKFLSLKIPQQTPPPSLDCILDYINAFLSIYTPFWDDVICLTRLGVLKDPNLLAMADKHTANGWFVAICINLRKTLQTIQAEEQLQHKESTVEKSPYKQQQYRNRILFLKVSYAKLLSDFCFCSFDTFHIKKSAYISQTLFGLISAILGLYKMQLRLSK